MQNDQLSLQAKIEFLQENPHNLRAINTTDFEKLKKHIEMLGQHSPLLVTPEEGKLTVLGGNMRLRAMKELAVTNPEKFGTVWVNVVDFQQDENNGLFYAYLNGVRQAKSYGSRKDAMMEYALSHNDRAGYYDADLLANEMPNYDIDWNEYSVDISAPESVQDLIDSVAPEPKEEKVPVEKLAKCPDCGREFDPSESYVEKPTITSQETVDLEPEEA